MPGVVDPELYTRWVEFGAFSPILRTHTTKNPDAERRIWAYPEPYSQIMRDTFHLRYALQPYLYTEGRRTYDTGVAFLHPLYYDWPEADAAYDNKDEYVFGSEMIVAPVTKPVDSSTQLAQETVWIPPGEWVERATGRRFTGSAEVSRNFSIDQIPVYVRSGAIVPLAPPMEYTDQKPVDPLILKIFPLSDRQTSTYRLYSDSSKAEAYKRDVCTWTALSAKQKGDVLTVEIAPVAGSYPGMITRRAYQLQLPGDWPPGSVTVDGTRLGFTGQRQGKVGWRYEGNTLMTVITTPQFSVHTPVSIEVRRAVGSLASRGKLDGFAGSVARLGEAYDTLNALYPLAWSPHSLIDAWQTGDRLSYHPETARQEIARFPRVYAEGVAAVRELVSNAGSRLQQRDATAHKDRAEHYQLYLSRAAAMLEDGKLHN